MADNFSINVKWRTVLADCLSKGEGSAMIDLKIDAGNQTLTLSKNLKHEHKDSVLVSALPLAWWLCANYWRIGYEPGLPPGIRILAPVIENWRMAHCMLGIGDGYAWPNITFYAEGPNECIEAQSQDKYSSAGQPLSYLCDCDVICSKEEFLTSIKNLIAETAERVERLEPDFLADWRQLKDESEHEGITAYRMLEAMLGRDVGYAPSALMADFITALKHIEFETLCEIACGLNPIYGVSYDDQRQSLRRCIDLSNGGIATRINVPSPAPENGFPWVIGRKLATNMRKFLGLEPDQSVPKNFLLDCFSLTAKKFSSIKSAGNVSISKVRGHRMSLVFPRHGNDRYATSRIFQLARALGGFLSLETDSNAMVMSASQTREQQIQRNFATEFLAPFEAVKAMLPEKREPNKDDIKKIASHYQTSLQTIVHSLINKGELSPQQGIHLLA